VTELVVVCALQVALVAFVLMDRRHERREVAAERSELLQRIQAPEHAVIDHYNRAVDMDAAPPAVNPEGDDDEYWESKERMAERLAADEVSHG
jgi:hypothetical protein